MTVRIDPRYLRLVARDHRRIAVVGSILGGWLVARPRGGCA